MKLGMTVLSFLMALPSIAYDFKVDGLYYKIESEEENTVILARQTDNTYTNSIYTGEIRIPSKVIHNDIEYTVSGIDERAFYKSEVTKVIMPESILFIGRSAFEGSTQMETCEMSPNISEIGKFAFENCTKLMEIEIPQNVSQIKLGTFYKCESLSKIIIPKSITEIVYSSATYAASGTGALGVTQGYPCFAECTNLKIVIFEDSDQPIDLVDLWTGSPSTYALYANEIFYGCPIEEVYIGRTLGYSTKSVFQDFKTLTKVSFGNQLSKIQDYAFQNCPNITNICIPDNITSIGFGAFDNCTKLTEVYIGNGVESIPSNLFDACTNLKNIFIGNKLRTIKNDVFSKCSNLEKIVICSNGIKEFGTHNVPNNATFYLPEYNDLFADFKVNLITTVTGGAFEYSGKEPTLSMSRPLESINLTADIDPDCFNVGHYTDPITITASSGNGWQSSFKTAADFSITPASLTVIPNNVSRQYGTDNPEFTCSYFGFKNDETAEVLTKLPKLETTATATSPVGTYPIVATGAEAQNYSFIYDRGTLTITKADQQIDWTQTFEEAKVGDVIKLEASSTSGLPVKYSVTDETVASIYSESGTQYVEILKSGTLYINATQAGNENYNEAEKVSKKITVTPIEPETPENPSHPENPDTPDTPGNPENPDDPEKPTDPDKPATPENPDNPDNPEEPVDPDKPTNPDQPTDPDKPTDPENPANPDQPTDPEQPENPGDDDNTDSINDVAGDAGISVSADGGIIVVNAPDSVKIEVYTLTGTLLRSTHDHRIGGLARGIYIVRIATRSFKIAL